MENIVFNVLLKLRSHILSHNRQYQKFPHKRTFQEENCRKQVILQYSKFVSDELIVFCISYGSISLKTGCSKCNYSQFMDFIRLLKTLKRDYKPKGLSVLFINWFHSAFKITLNAVRISCSKGARNINIYFTQNDTTDRLKKDSDRLKHYKASSIFRIASEFTKCTKVAIKSREILFLPVMLKSLTNGGMKQIVPNIETTQYILPIKRRLEANVAMIYSI